MRIKDIEVGGEYAIAEQFEWKPGRWDAGQGQRASKAVVLETGVERRGSANKDGVRLRVIEPHTYRLTEGQVVTIRAAEVREKWTEFAPRRKRWEDEQARAKDSARRAAETVTARIKDTLPEGFDVTDIVPRKNHNGTYTTSVQVQYTRLANVLEEVAIAARAEALS